MIYEPINEVLTLNNKELGRVIAGIKSETMSDTELILQLSVIKARGDVLEILTDYDAAFISPLDSSEDEVPLPPEPVPYFIAEVKDDNPEQEDKDAKKAREEELGFFG